MTVSELAAVLERQSDIYDAAMEIPDVVAVLRESAAILRRLGDDALAKSVAADCRDPAHDLRWCSTCATRFDGIDAYRRRVLTPAEGEEIEK